MRNWSGIALTLHLLPNLPGAQPLSLFTDASRYIPGGVNSPVRAFRSVGGEPLFIDRARGPYVSRPMGGATSTTSARGDR